MKKFFTLALAASAAVAANAQYSVNPSTAEVASKNPSTVKYITLSEGAVAELEKAGAKVTYVGPDPEAQRNLWYWENTFTPGDESYPRVDQEEGGYISVVVGNVGWSGAGLACDAPLDLSNFNDETRFHLAYMTPTSNGPASIAIILMDQEKLGSVPAKFALGTAFVDGGATYPAIAPAVNDDWQGIDISFADLKKIWPQFNIANKAGWTGNLMSFLGGAVTGQTFALDAVYFYNVGSDSGVDGVEADENLLVITDRTVNSGVAGINIYDLQGRCVKSVAGNVAGIEDLAAGIYVAKSGSSVKKFVVR